MQLRSRIVALFALSLAGCYHASVETGRQPGQQHVEKGWASSYFAGAIPPSTVDVRSACTNGVSKVETKHSFLNMLVGSLTLSIYTPISIDVTCAAGTATQTPQRPATSMPAGRTSASR